MNTMANLASNFDITFVQFLRFLNGHSLEGCGNSGGDVLDATIKILKDTFRGQLDKLATHPRLPNYGPYHLLSTVFSYLEPELVTHLGIARCNQKIIGMCQWWIVDFKTKQILPQINPLARDDKDPLMEDFLDDDTITKIVSYVYELENHSLTSGDKESRLDGIVTSLIVCMKRFLDSLGQIQCRRMQGTPPRTISPPLAGAEGTQDATTTEFRDWKAAWTTPFHGSALHHLETKLRLNAKAIRYQQNRMQTMSRIIPIVQSSGTGKSRLAEEYVKQNFAVTLGLKNGSSFPPMDEYVSQYFRSAHRLERQIQIESSRDLDSGEFLRFSVQDDQESKLGTGMEQFTPKQNSVYYGEDKYKRPNRDSKPNRWAAVARLRVACFLAGFFDTMLSYMQSKKYDNIESWRTGFLHGTEGCGNRRKAFWKEVITATFAHLYKDNGAKQQSWLGVRDQEPDLTNGGIDDALQSILQPSMHKFFTSGTFRKFLSECHRGRSAAESPFLLIIDEAAYLYHTSYMHSFMWVLDQPVMEILCQELADQQGRSASASRFFVLMLGTHSQISHFAPHYYFPSERYYDGKQHIPSVFLSLPWDSGVECLDYPPLFESGAHIRMLKQWGRPIWSSAFSAFRANLFRGSPDDDAVLNDIKDKLCLSMCVNLAKRKIDPILYNDEDRQLSTFAALAIRLHLDLDFVFPTRASQLVASKMRWLIDVDPQRKFATTTYGSEPLLVEAAALLMNGPTLLKGELAEAETTPESPLAHVVTELHSQLCQGHVNRGENGELSARLLLLMAKDQATRELWWRDKQFLAYCSRRGIPNATFFEPKHPYFFREAQTYYCNPITPYAFYHRAVKVKDFLKAFLDAKVFDELEMHFKETKKWKSLDKAYVNFTHWVLVKGSDSDIPYQKNGFFGSWLRQNAYLCQRNFARVDIVIPMAFRFKEHDGDTVDIESVSYIIISIKNCEGSEGLDSPYLSREAVEGVVSTEESTKKNRGAVSSQGNKRQKGNDGSSVQMSSAIKGKDHETEDNEEDSMDGTEVIETVRPDNDNLNLRLTLHSLKFVNPEGVVSSTPTSTDSWIATSEEKPFIAFAMSMGQTERQEKLFIGEEHADYNTHRIAFALRGFKYTYNFPDTTVQDNLVNINLRHDISGDYPQSALDFPRAEKELAAEARKPLDNLFDYLEKLSLEREEDEVPAAEEMDWDCEASRSSETHANLK